MHSGITASLDSAISFNSSLGTLAYDIFGVGFSRMKSTYYLSVLISYPTLFQEFLQVCGSFSYDTYMYILSIKSGGER